jgi:hypothetical protein
VTPGQTQEWIMPRAVLLRPRTFAVAGLRFVKGEPMSITTELAHRLRGDPRFEVHDLDEPRAGPDMLPTGTAAPNRQVTAPPGADRADQALAPNRLRPLRGGRRGKVKLLRRERRVIPVDEPELPLAAPPADGTGEDAGGEGAESASAIAV